MFDAALRPMIDRILDPAGRRLAAAGISANQATLAGFVCGIGAASAVLVGWTAAAVTLLLLNRFLDGLDGAIARAVGKTDLGGFLDITMDFLIYSAIPFAFAVKDPANALAAAFLIFSFVGTGSSFLAYAIIAQKRGISTERRGKKSFFHLGGLTEGTETIIFLVIVTAEPTLFIPLAWGFGALCWITTSTRIAEAFRNFR